jgi:serine/threonine protein kinase
MNRPVESFDPQSENELPSKLIGTDQETGPSCHLSRDSVTLGSTVNKQPSDANERSTNQDKQGTNSDFPNSDFADTEFADTEFFENQKIDEAWMGRVLDRIKAEPPPDAVGRVWRIGDHIANRYRLEKVLGSGGYGLVFRATDITLQRDVAVKLLHPDSAQNVRQRELFEREARAASRIHHKNVVAVYTTDITEDGTYFLVMELIDGTPLKSSDPRFKNRTYKEIVEFVIQAAEGLQAAHEAGLIHRDVKGSNLLVDKSGVVKVADFGLAILADVSVSRTEPAGTLPYMSPEQVANPGQLDPRTDVYSLGAVLYELIASTPPFQGTEAAILKQLMGDDPRPLIALAPDCPTELATITTKCLSKERSRRYESAKLLAEDLERWRTGRPILARPVSRFEQCWKWVRRKPLISGLTSAVLISLIASLALSYYLLHTQRQLTKSLEATDNMTRGLESLNYDPYELASLIVGRTVPEKNSGSSDCTMYLNDGLKLAEQKKWAEATYFFERAVESDPSRRLARLFLTTAYGSTNQLDKWLEASTAFVNDFPEDSRAYSSLGEAFQVLAIRKDGVEKLALLRKAEFELRKSVAVDPANLSSISLLGEILTDIGELDEAKQLLEKVMAINPTSQDIRRMRDLFRATNDVDQAHDLAERLHATKMTSPTDILVLGRIKRDKGELNRAVELFFEYIEASKGKPTSDSTDVVYNDIAVVLIGLERFEEALGYLKRLEASLGDNPIYQTNRGIALLGMLRNDEALVWYRKALGATTDDRANTLQPQQAFLVCGQSEQSLQIAESFGDISQQPRDRELLITVALARLAEIAKEAAETDGEGLPWKSHWDSLQSVKTVSGSWNYFFLDRWVARLDSAKRVAAESVIHDLEKRVRRRYPKSPSGAN